MAKLDDAAALDQIAKVLSGQEWDGDTLEDIAEIIEATGREVIEPEGEEGEDEED